MAKDMVVAPSHGTGSSSESGGEVEADGTRQSVDMRAKADAPRKKSTDATAKPSPREVRRWQRIELSREQILDTAEELFADRGFYETGLKDVAARCEFSVGSIYSFFESKDELYEQVLMRRDISVESLRDMLPESMPIDAQLVRIAEIWINHAAEYPAWGALTAEVTRIARSPGSSIPEAWSQRMQLRQKFLVELIKKGQADGTLRHGSPSSLARLFYAVVTSFIVVTTMGKMRDTEDPDDAEEFLGFVQDTFSTQPSTNPNHEDFDD